MKLGVRASLESGTNPPPFHKHWYVSTLHSITSIPLQSLSESGDLVIHSYSTVFHGLSALLTPNQKHSRPSTVHAVIPEQIRKICTTRSPQFLGLKSQNSSRLLAESDFGSDLVIDTGIWPDCRNFNDRDLWLIPPKWKGECVHTNDFPGNVCNRKLIGARFFSGGYEATNGKMNETSEYRRSATPMVTASIAAGCYVFPALTLGYARGVAAGMAPKARLAAYKVCWAAGCFDSDILAAFNSAVANGVDVISLSVEGVVVPYYLDAIAIGAFSAADTGIFVSASASADNGGPEALVRIIASLGLAIARIDPRYSKTLIRCPPTCLLQHCSTCPWTVVAHAPRAPSRHALELHLLQDL